MAGEVGKENLLLLSNVIAMRQLVVSTATGFACGTLAVMCYKKMTTMKKHIIILTMLLLTLTIVRGQTSVYHPFPDSNAVWTVYCQGYPGLCQCSCTLCIYNETDQDSLGGDTVIGSYAYHKLYNQYARLDYCDSPPSCSPGYYPSTTTNYNYQYYGAIRQNISLKKVYIYYRQSSTEQLLYDFDLHVGDTLQATMITPANTNYVHKIDSFLVSGNYRKRFWIWYKAGTPPTSADSGSGTYVPSSVLLASTYSSIRR